MTLTQAVILAIVEGFSEFLPISSTGHMIIASSTMGIAQADVTKVFTVCIQFGAVLSVLVLYWRRFTKSKSFYAKLLVGFLPSAIIGKLLNDRIDALLENVMVVATTLLIGGIILVFVDRWFEKGERDENVTYRKAFWIGVFQCIAMVPGVSRSGATILGGLAQGLTRKMAAEFSFLLAVPTMFAATCYKLYKFVHHGAWPSNDFWTLLVVGNVVAFVVALIVIKAFIGYLNRHGFRIFGYYRIALGLGLIGLHLLGVPLHF